MCVVGICVGQLNLRSLLCPEIDIMSSSHQGLETVEGPATSGVKKQVTPTHTVLESLCRGGGGLTELNDIPVMDAGF
jgi:hypothetical protein